MRKLIAVFLFSLVAVSAPLHAKTFKIATISPDGLTWMKQLREGAKEIEARTDGRVKFKIYPGGVQGDDFTVLRKMRIGQLHGGAVSSTTLIRFFPDLQVYSLPLVFNDFEEVDYIRERMDQQIIDGLYDNGIVSFSLTETGFAYLQSDTPVTTLEELQEKDTWVPTGDPLAEQMIKTFDVNPIPLLLTDVLAALQTGLVDAVTVPPLVALALQWHNHIDYMVDVPLLYTYSMMMLDKKAFESISEGDQAIVTEVMNRVFSTIDDANRQDNRNAYQALLSQGVELTAPTEEQLSSWRKLAENSIDGLVDEGEISAEIVRQLRSFLAEYRSQVSGTATGSD